MLQQDYTYFFKPIIMSRKASSYAILLSAIILCTLQGWAQNEVRHSSVAVPNGESWLPINKFSAPVRGAQTGKMVAAEQPFTNVLNGVSFYRMRSECNSSYVALLKVINTNNYPVNLSWQRGPGTGVESVVIPAHQSIEGACSSGDATRDKLAFTLPTGPDKEKVKEFLFSSFKVTESKK